MTQTTIPQDLLEYYAAAIVNEGFDVNWETKEIEYFYEKAEKSLMDFAEAVRKLP